MNKGIKILLFTFFVFLIAFSLVKAIDSNSEGWKLDPSETLSIDVNSVCRDITNTGSNTYFVPTKTEAEWTYFINNSPSDVTILGCDPCTGVTEVELWGTTYDVATTTDIYQWSVGLTGTIPPEIGCLTNLTSLRIGSNQLTGEIPPEIGNLTNLQRLQLHNNQLTGSIPPELGNLTNLGLGLGVGEYGGLNLWANQLTGEIPPSLGNLTNTYQVNLYENQLTGDIPSELCNLTTTSFIALHTNQLTGDIPQCICDLIAAGTLNWGEMYPILDGNPGLNNTCG